MEQKNYDERSWRLAILGSIIAAVVYVAAFWWHFVAPVWRAERYIVQRGGQVWREWHVGQNIYGASWPDSEVTDDDLEFVVKLSPVVLLVLCNNANITDAGVEVLCNFPENSPFGRLNYIDISGTSITSAGVEQLKSRFRRAEVVTEKASQ